MGVVEIVGIHDNVVGFPKNLQVPTIHDNADLYRAFENASGIGAHHVQLYRDGSMKEPISRNGPPPMLEDDRVYALLTLQGGAPGNPPPRQNEVGCCAGTCMCCRMCCAVCDTCAPMCCPCCKACCKGCKVECHVFWKTWCFWRCPCGGCVWNPLELAELQAPLYIAAAKDIGQGLNKEVDKDKVAKRANKNMRNL